MVDETGFGARVRLLRHKKGLTLRELAKRVDLDFSYLSKIENDKLPPPADATIMRLSKALDIDPDQLFSIARKVPTDLRQRVKEAPPQTAFLMRKLSTSQLSDEQYRQIMEILNDASHD